MKTTNTKRLIAFVALVLTVAIAVRSSNLTEVFTPESIREQIQRAGMTPPTFTISGIVQLLL